MPITRGKFITTGLLITTGVMLADAFWAEKFFIETNQYYLGSAAKSKKNLQVVQISDLHLHSITPQLIQLANRLNKLQPDLVVFTGDAIDDANKISILNRFLQLIDKGIQKVAILGNWEYQAKVDLTELNKIYAGNNCRLLINQTVQFSFQQKTISITGVDDYLRGNADFAAAIKDYKKSDYHIILTHCPKFRDTISDQLNKDMQVDFILSGHTHGGQFNLFGFAPYLPRGSGKYVKGWYTKEHPKLYVSKGIGTVFFPVRFGARAEIAIFNFAT